MNGLDRNRWNMLWREAAAQPENRSLYDRLVQLYSEPHRHYHNSRHIVDCLNAFDFSKHLAKEPIAVELAIWFHDAIYNLRASDNEEQSADLARKHITEAGFAKSLSESVTKLVLSTKQHDASLHPDASLLVDIDLSILGEQPERFWEYEDQIRKEYEWVPEDIFKAKRAEILERFLARKRIYNTDYYFSRFEAQARTNLNQSIAKLRNG